ncbi:MAG: hypothetical protein HYX72_04485 [Acidobacteria bacterium]|nr:hypothetical protein [Acidobacteriota bacterium]
MRRSTLGGVAAALLLSAAVARTASMTIPAGATISVRMTDVLDSKTNRNGETFRATVDAPVMMNGTVVIPKGAEAIGRITDVEPSRRLRGRAMLTVELTALNFDGKSVAVHTGTFQEGSASRGKQTMKIAGAATAIGTVVGLIGGAPWIGTGVGAAAGMVVQTVRGPAQIRIPAESLLSFTLLSPLPVE